MTLLDVDELREHIQTTLVDAALQRLLDDAEALIVGFGGDVSAAEEIVRGGSPRITVARPIDSVSAIRERDNYATPVTVAVDDWEQNGRFTLTRLRYGTNRSSVWRGPVRVTYVPIDDTDTRKMVQVELVKLEIATSPGLASETVGAWTQTYSSIGSKSVPEQRADILSRLVETAGFLVVAD